MRAPTGDPFARAPRPALNLPPCPPLPTASSSPSPRSPRSSATSRAICDRLREARAEAAAFGADIVMSPELFLSGYPPEDLVLKPAFQEACRAACEELARDTADGGPACWSACPGSRTASSITPWRCLMAGGSRRCGSRSICPITACSTKSACSRPARRRGRSSFRGVRVGIPICEDIWGPDPVECIPETGGEILLVPNASPYERGKVAIRADDRRRARRRERPAADLSQQGRRPGRTRVRRRLLSRSTPTARSARNCRRSARSSRAPSGSAAPSGWRCVEGPRAIDRGGRRGRLRRLRARPARLCREQPLSRRRARPVGRRRFGALRRDGGRRAGRRRASRR